MNICELCINEYSKDDYCNVGHEQYSLSNVFIKCVDFIIKREYDPIELFKDFCCVMEDLIKMYKKKFKLIEDINKEKK